MGASVSVDAPANVTEEEFARFSAYPGGFCCGQCPYIIQCPWRCCQCMVGSCCFLLLHLPILLFVWVLSCCHGCCCNCCCPVLVGDPPLRYASEATDARCLSRHSRRFFGCWTLRLISTPPQKRNICWRCIHHFVCCCASIDRMMNILDDDSAWVREQRNDFGEYFPIFGTICVANYDDAVELLCGTDAYRDGFIIAGQTANSVLAHQVKGTASVLPVDADGYDEKRQMFRVVLGDGLERLRRAFHGGDATVNIPETGEQILARLREIADPKVDIRDKTEGRRLVAQIMFYLLTGGALTTAELRAVSPEAFQIFDDSFHWLAGGYFFLYRYADAVNAINHAALRHPKYLERIVSYCRENDIDPVVGMNQVGVCMVVAGTVAVLRLAHHVLYLMNRDPAKYVPLFNEHPMKFVKECARIMPGPKDFSQRTTCERQYMSGGREVSVFPGDFITVTFSAVNTSYDAYKSLNMTFDPDHVTDPSYEEERMVTWAGVEGEFSVEDPLAGQPRGCPGRYWALVVVGFLVDVYKPKLDGEEITCCCG